MKVTNVNEKFQCSSASRKFLNNARAEAQYPSLMFQCSSASRKFLNLVKVTDKAFVVHVSVLFSEPKIPQFAHNGRRGGAILPFQCSSASRKFLNARRAATRTARRGFSALQRAENSSMEYVTLLEPLQDGFQCSSASRKFLNIDNHSHRKDGDPSFSALQRAENSSMPRSSRRAGRR